MKLFASCMSIYLLVLSFIPCGDIMECNVMDDGTISVSQDHHQDKHHLEHCTPFCGCACSSGFYHVVPLILQHHHHLIQSGNPLYYHSSFTAGVSYSIWQPPKLG
ncbi:MAG: DUF6660 family protein [Saprospiraceae bacterium]